MYAGNIRFLIIMGLLLSVAVTGFLLSCKYSVSAYQKMMRENKF